MRMLTPFTLITELKMKKEKHIKSIKFRLHCPRLPCPWTRNRTATEKPEVQSLPGSVSLRRWQHQAPGLGRLGLRVSSLHAAAACWGFWLRSTKEVCAWTHNVNNCKAKSRDILSPLDRDIDKNHKIHEKIQC